MNPNLSIVMPTYNRGDSFLKEAVLSILKQSYNNFELIIIDDASTDDTEAIIKSLHDERIVYYKTSVNHGEYWATDFGVNMARGKYLTWVHSDDLLPENSLQSRVDMLDQNSEIDFVHGDISKIDEKGNLIENLEAVDWSKEEILSQYVLPEKERKTQWMIHHTTVMMKWKFFYMAGPFDCSLPYAGDIDWLIRAIRQGNFKHINKVVYSYRKHQGTRRVVDVKNGIDPDQINSMIARRYIK